MSNRILPHAVTYYRRRAGEEGGDADYERHVLCPVMVREEVEECDGVILRKADLFILRDELLTPMPEPQIGDYFIRGKWEDAAPPVEQGAYRVCHMLPKLDHNILKLAHLEGIGAGGVTDAL